MSFAAGLTLVNSMTSQEYSVEAKIAQYTDILTRITDNKARSEESKFSMMSGGNNSDYEQARARQEYIYYNQLESRINQILNVLKAQKESFAKLREQFEKYVQKSIDQVFGNPYQR